METPPPSPDRGPSRAEPFSLLVGGPLFQLWRRTQLSGSELEWMWRRIVVLSLIAWLPLLLLCAWQGSLLGANPAASFLLDVEAHVRFLLAMPLLIATEVFTHRRMRHVPGDFLERRLIPEAELPRFLAARESASRLRNSVWAELLLVAFVYLLGQLVWHFFLSVQVGTWYAAPQARGAKLSAAGGWYRYVSLPLFQFLLCRWYFRVFIWARFLRQVSRIPLRLIPTHPDRVGGLGFLSQSVYGLLPLAVAHGALLSGQIARRVLLLGASLPDFKFEIPILLLFVLFLGLGPLTMFSPQLWREKLLGDREYGTFAERYVREFDTKWLRGGAPAEETPLGTPDLQSLADLANSFEVVRTARILPFTQQVVIGMVISTLAPLLPLVLTMMPLQELLRRLFGLVF